MAVIFPGTSLQDSEDSALAALGRAWWLVLFFGIVSIGLGIAVMVWPNASVAVVAYILAIWLVISGIFTIVRGFAGGISGGMRALLIITGILSLILGLFAFSGHEDSIFRAEWILAIFIGISFLFQGFAALFAAAESGQGRGWNIFGGIVLLIAGIVVLVVPGKSLFALAIVVGVWLLIMGIFAIVSAFSIKSTVNRLA
jgi:uncharacterized membrane protein HdeD (DUF308 family)